MPRSTEGVQRNNLARREREPGGSSVIIAVTTSPRRKHLITSAFPSPQFEVRFVDGPNPELESDDLVSVARHKVEFVLDSYNPNNAREAFIGSRKNFVIAADVMTRPLLLNSSDIDQKLVADRPAKTIALGKPESLEQIRGTLVKMVRAAGKHDVCYYTAATGTFVRGRSYHYAAPDSTTAVLNIEKMGDYSTPKGFPDYVAGFYGFYTSEAYAQRMARANPDASAPNITEVAGGLSLGTLLYLDVVESIDGVPREDKARFRIAAKNALEKVLFGFNVGVLKRIRPEIQQFMDSYDLLEVATALALREPLPA